MKSIVLSCFAFLLFLSVAGQDYITLYTDCNYRGRASKLYPGRYNLSSQVVGASQVSSLKVPAGWKVVLYDADNAGQGNKMRYTTDISCLNKDWNDRARSVVVERDNSYNNNNAYNFDNKYNSSSFNNNQGNGITVFADCNYRGSNRVFNEGSYNHNDLGVGNDQISSIRIPSGWSVTVYENGDYRGNSRTFTGSISCLNGDWNDKISSMRVNRGYNNNNGNNYNTNGGDVTLFEDCNYRGNAQSFGNGRYSTLGYRIGNDAVSSIRVPAGKRLIVYSDANFRGSRGEFNYDVSCLPRNWNDQISSFIVENSYGNNYNTNNNNYSYGNAVKMHADEGYKGPTQSYNTGRFSLNGSPLDKSITSITVESGYSIVIYDEYYYRGNSMVITATIKNLNMVGWNDRIRSFEVRRN